MSKDLLNKIKGAIDKNEAPGSVKPEEKSNVEPVANSEPLKEKPEPKVKATSDKPVSVKQKKQKGLTGFEELLDILKAEKESFSFNRRLVYIDDNIGEVLDLLRKEAKINSNVLASYLLKKFLLEHKDLIKGLQKKRKDNMFLD